jgi:L-alanine-DL-glutamate epimerase-like enolase superfamily enzyme
MRITSIDCHVLLQPAFDITAASSAQDDIVVEIHTDEGISGIGETDVNPWIAKACIEAPGSHNMGVGLTELLVGLDPMDVEGIWERMYVSTAMNGRRGAVINAIGALDIALHDLRGKALGVPCYELLGGAVQSSITPYASLQPETNSYAEYRESLIDWAQRAVNLGFHAVKAEITLEGPFAHTGMREPWERSTEVLAGVRKAVGPDTSLMIDVQYAFPDADTALRVLKTWEEFNLFFVETPLWPDDLEGYRRLADEQSIPIAAGEWLTTRFEHLDLMDRGGVRIVQPDIGRVGGLTEAKRVCQLAADRGLSIVPHLWKTGISVAAAAHLATATPNCPFIEYMPAELTASGLRRDLADDGMTLVDGKVSPSSGPGLGIDINRDALEYYAAVARESYQP